MFKKKSNDSNRSTEESLEGYEAFQCGINSYLKKDISTALRHFNKSIESGYKQSDVFSYRAHCLQILGYHNDAINDFDKAISLSSRDTNDFFGRSVSKGAIKDYKGEISDLEKAIVIVKEENVFNKAYNDEATKDGYKNASDLFEARLLSAKLNLEVSTMKKYYYYNFRQGQFIFKIQPTGNQWVLFCDNKPFNTYNTPEEAAVAVSSGETGYQLWDNLTGEEPINLSAWEIKES